MMYDGKASLDGLHADISDYYTEKVMRHGPTPLGVDWPCQPTQELRFIQLLRICDFTAPFSLNDFGCGYGALLAFLGRRHRGKKVSYLGIDLSPAMVAEARKLWGRRSHTTFLASARPDRISDYAIASGIFNVKLHHTDEAWTDFISQTLHLMHTHSRRGFSVNFLNPLPDGMVGELQLYRTKPEVWAEFCEQALDTKVEVLSGYGMREHTLNVRHR